MTAGAGRELGAGAALVLALDDGPGWGGPGLVATGAAVVVAGLVALLLRRFYRKQHESVFRPSRRKLGDPSDYGIEYEDVFFGAEGEERGMTGEDSGLFHGWWIPASGSADGVGERPAGDKLVLYFHGSAGNLSFELPTLQFLHARGFAVMAIDYPGYGQSEGRATERGCLQAAAAAARFARRRGYREGETVLYGQSLGCAVAAHLARGIEYRCVVLHSGFRSIPRLAKTRWPQFLVRLFCWIRLDCEGWLEELASPLLVLHGAGDRIVPISHGRALYQVAETPKRFLELRGGHLDLAWRQEVEVREVWREIEAGRAGGWRGNG